MTHRTDTVARALHDVGLAAWFGGSLMGAAGVNPATRELENKTDALRVANSAWGRWTPFALGALVAHGVGAAQLTRANKSRMLGQRNVGSTAAAKAVLTTAALGATAYSRVLGQKLMEYEGSERQRDSGAGNGSPVEGATEPSQDTPEEFANAQRQLRLLQWTVPALAGANIVLNAVMGEQQRPTEVARGVVRRLLPV